MFALPGPPDDETVVSNADRAMARTTSCGGAPDGPGGADGPRHARTGRHAG